MGRSRSRTPPSRSSASHHHKSSRDRDRSDRDRDHHHHSSSSSSSRRDRGARNERTRSRSPLPPSSRDHRRGVDDFGRERKVVESSRRSPPPVRGRDRSPARRPDRRDRAPSSSRDRRDDYRRDDHRRDARDRPDRRDRGDHERDSRSGASSSRRDRDRGRSRSRTPPPAKNGHAFRGGRSPSSSPEHGTKNGNAGGGAAGAVPKFLLQRPEITDADLEGKTEEEQDMMKIMGFGGFDTTKGKKVSGNDVSAVNLLQKRKYRQYMNRKGGFNRPLDFVA